MITWDNLTYWKQNSIDIAKELRLLEDSVLEELKNANLCINTKKRPEGICYGFAHYDAKEIEIYSQNPSTEGLSSMLSLLKEDGMPQSKIKDFINSISRIPDKKAFEIFNQSGMDHELIGHLGNYLSNKEHNETAASAIQKIMAEYRGKIDPVWNLVIELIPIFQKYHRNVKLNTY